jgi:hypothetical protein
MTPKEKAEELYFKYYKNLNIFSYKRIKAKKCALIAVDEILDHAGMIWSGIYTETGMTAKGEIRKKYWQEVKQEIDKL